MISLSATLHSRSLGLSLSHSSSNIWQLVFDVDHKTTVSWQMEKCRLYELTRSRGPTRGPPYWISRELQRPLATVGPPLNGDLCFLWASITRPARGQRAARSEGQLTVQVSISLFFVSLFFHTKQFAFFFLRIFALLLPTVRTQYSCNGCRLCCCCSCSLLRAALSNREKCLFLSFFICFFLSLSA